MISDGLRGHAFTEHAETLSVSGGYIVLPCWEVVTAAGLGLIALGDNIAVIHSARLGRWFFLEWNGQEQCFNATIEDNVAIPQQPAHPNDVRFLRRFTGTIRSSQPAARLSVLL